jgi:hypothetical protein
MRWLRLAIARLLGLQTQHLGNPVQPTQTAGPVDPEHMTQAGSKPSAEDTHPRPHLPQPAQPRSRKKPKVVQLTSQGLSGTSKKQKPVQTGKSPTTGGNSTQTPVPPTPQVASQAPTKKQKAADSTSRGKKPTPNKTSALTRTARPSKGRGS